MEEVLDRGAFGEVSRGRWRGNEVAVKVGRWMCDSHTHTDTHSHSQLFNTGRPTPETIEAFQREVFVMNCLRHPNVVLLLGACQTPPKLAIIMEYVAGGSLHQVRGRGEEGGGAIEGPICSCNGFYHVPSSADPH